MVSDNLVKHSKLLSAFVALQCTSWDKQEGLVSERAAVVLYCGKIIARLVNEDSHVSSANSIFDLSGVSRELLFSDYSENFIIRLQGQLLG